MRQTSEIEEGYFFLKASIVIISIINILNIMLIHFTIKLSDKESFIGD